ncbi:oxygen-independent coproporphyrinogen III oxidase [Sphingomonas mesophila]|uniref:oxygen-independent coproporphyrinogen III oxidase n=1 Tax=Sphingomonas mesophila TaxID=2303576 RepID=UPI0019677280|nr:oxygen-independent coproporphyrinogen III oxidase [Sphingomonas mesophila]
MLTPELLARYGDACIPRYTSYPTAPHFSDAVGAGDYRSWLEDLPPGDLSLYVHIPFCRKMCWYCGCHTTVSAREAPVSRYLASLTREMELVADCLPRRQGVSHLHFGGGTPTIMTAGEMRRLMAGLAARFAFAEDAEIAIEIDPRTLEPDMARALGECGFNRASLGVQSFDISVQRAINRVQSLNCTEAAVSLLRANGVQRVNLDLVYGLPFQTVGSCRETVEQCLTLRPDRLAVFGYAHVPAFKPHQRKIDGASLPDSESRFAQSRAIHEALSNAGYVQIGLDHFALPDDPLAIAARAGRLHRNFQGYTTDSADVLIGLGASSIGRLPQGFVQNAVAIPAYQEAIERGDLPVARGYRLSGEDRLRGAVIERLMCDHQVDLGRVCAPFGADPAKLLDTASLGPLMVDGLVEVNGTRLSVPRHARQLIRSVAAAFDAYLARGEAKHSRAV